MNHRLKHGGLFILAILLVFSLARLSRHAGPVADLLGLRPTYLPRPVDLVRENWWRPLPGETLTPDQRTERARTNSDKYFDPARTNESAYREKMRRHYIIAKYLTATRRHDPSYVAVMNLLASHGYGILEWDESCNAIINYQQSAFLRMSKSANGSAPESKIAPEIEFDSIQGYDFYVERFAAIFGLVDHEFFQKLLSIPLEFTSHEPLLGFPGSELQMGDRFFTDMDWLTPEVMAAWESYQGPDRSQWTRELRDNFAQFLRRSRYRSYGYSYRLYLAEDRKTVQDLIGFGLIQPEDLDGMEVVDRRFFEEEKF